MKKLILLLLLVHTATAFSQVPGYLGKKLSFYYTPSLFFSIQPKGIYLEDVAGNPMRVGINVRNDFAMDYVISRSVALGVSAKFISTKLGNVLYTANSNGYYPPAFLGDIALSGTAFSVYEKNFYFKTRGGIAPVGFYTSWEILYGQVSGKTGKRFSTAGAPDGYLYVNRFEDLRFQPSQNFYGILFSFGRQNLLFDRLFINTSGTIGLMPQGLRFPIGQEYYGDEGNYFDALHYRMLGYFLFTFNIGIGLLAL